MAGVDVACDVVVFAGERIGDGVGVAAVLVHNNYLHARGSKTLKDVAVEVAHMVHQHHHRRAELLGSLALVRKKLELAMVLVLAAFGLERIP